MVKVQPVERGCHHQEEEEEDEDVVSYPVDVAFWRSSGASVWFNSTEPEGRTIRLWPELIHTDQSQGLRGAAGGLNGDECKYEGQGTAMVLESEGLDLIVGTESLLAFVVSFKENTFGNEGFKTSDTNVMFLKLKQNQQSGFVFVFMLIQVHWFMLVLANVRTFRLQGLCLCDASSHHPRKMLSLLWSLKKRLFMLILAETQSLTN